MLKELLGSLTSTPVELVFCAGDTLHFRCSRDLPYDKVARVRAKLPEGQMFGAKIHVHTIDEKTDLHVGRLLEPVHAIPHLKHLLPLPFENRRAVPRIERKVRVLSPQIEGYSCLTRDLSSEGICLVMSHVVPPGTAMQLEMDLDTGHAGQPVRFDVETRWAAPDLFSNNHLVGGCFQTINNRQRQLLKSFLAGSNV
jgi:hypothetical protein